MQTELANIVDARQANRNKVKMLEYFQQFGQPFCKTGLQTERPLSNLLANIATINTMGNFLIYLF